MIRWPRGKHNGRRIVGITVKVVVRLDGVRWRPIVVRHVGGLHWLCFYTFWNWTFS